MSKDDARRPGRRELAADKAVPTAAWPRRPVKIRFFVDSLATRCSMCNRQRVGVQYVGATADGGNYYFAFCADCVRGLHGELS